MTFEQWMNVNLGSGITDLFMKPYNEKVWAIHPSRMQSKWLGERVATVNVTRLIEDVILNKTRAGWGPNKVI